MLFYIFLVLGTWKGVLGEDDICDKHLPEVCTLPDDWRVPATEADVDRMCPEFIAYLDCVEDHSRKCDPEDPNKNFRQKLRVLAEEACRKDSQLHSRIVENIGCFHETFTNDLEGCLEYLREKSAAIIKRVNSIVPETVYGEDANNQELWTPYTCLVHSLETLCMARKSSARCGSETRSLLLELVGRTGFIQHSCAAANEERLAEYIALLELELEEGTTLNQILGRE